MAVTFQLCDVPRATSPLPEVAVEAAVQELLGTPVEACGAGVTGLFAVQANAFVGAAWRAFADHRPLVLGPDAVWLCIAQGFAAHVGLHAEALRGRFVRHEGKAKLLVRRDDFLKGSPDNPWPEVFAEFSRQIAGHIGRQRDLVVCDFSTTGPIERAASEIVLMDAMRHYFEYAMTTLCGIPEITLTGTVDDWRSVRQRAQHLAEYGLEWWAAALIPLLDEFVAAASGRPDLALWRQFFKSSGGSGGPYLYGWIVLLFPYFSDGRAKRPRINPILAAARGAPPILPGGGLAPWIAHRSITPGGIPLGLARAPLTWTYFEQTFAMDLVGGFVGIAQDPTTLAIRPAIGWAVRDEADAVLVRVPMDVRRPAPKLFADPEDDSVADTPLWCSRGADDGVLLASERASCSRPATPKGRVLLAIDGLYFIPGVAREVGLDDDDRPELTDHFLAVRGRPPAEQAAAVPGSVHLTPAQLADSYLSGRAPGLARRSTAGEALELSVVLPTGERLAFTLFAPPREPFAAWCTAVGRHPGYGGPRRRKQ